MALKIFTEAKPFLKAYMKPFDITEIRMLTSDIDNFDNFVYPFGADIDNV
jgi:hypothetical protein